MNDVLNNHKLNFKIVMQFDLYISVFEDTMTWIPEHVHHYDMLSLLVWGAIMPIVNA